jgi:hypothetical protein
MTTKLDYQQVIQKVYDEGSEALRTTGGGAGSQDYVVLSSVDTTTINGNAGAFVEVVASLSAECVQVIPYDTTGKKIGVYSGAPASEQLLFILGPGQDQPVPCTIASGSRISVRSTEATGAVSGSLILTFVGRG